MVMVLKMEIASLNHITRLAEHADEARDESLFQVDIKATLNTYSEFLPGGESIWNCRYTSKGSHILKRLIPTAVTVKPACNDHLNNKINEDWRYQFTLANNFCPLELQTAEKCHIRWSKKTGFTVSVYDGNPCALRDTHAYINCLYTELTKTKSLAHYTTTEYVFHDYP